MGTPDIPAPAAPAAHLPLKPGDRVELRKERGYVRYVGPLEGQKGEWVGVDWDCKTRGRHDGSVAGRRYFTAAHATSGSFVRAAKIGCGSRCTLQDAMRARADADPVADAGVGSAPVGWVVGNAEVHVNFRARDLVRDESGLVDVPVLDVSEMGVCGFDGDGVAGSDQSVGIRMNALRSLRVAESLVEDWRFVQVLVAHLQGLRYLDVSRNRFDRLDCDREISGAPSMLEELVLNGCNIQLEGVLALCERCPKLAQLRLFNTGLKSLRNSGKFDAVKVLPSVRLIDLGGNKVPWRDAQDVLGRIATLEELFLGNNDIGLHEEELNADGLFPALHRLSLSENPISSWSLITSLVRMPSLRSLLIADTPLTKDEDDWDPVTKQTAMTDSSALLSRHGIMARLGQIQKLHGSVIEADERIYAEKRYLAVECLPSLKEAKTRAEAEKMHPRMHELCKFYDVDLESAAKEAVMCTPLRQGATLRADLVTVLFRAGANVTSVRKEVTKKLPRCVQVDKLRALRERFWAFRKEWGWRSR